MDTPNTAPQPPPDEAFDLDLSVTAAHNLVPQFSSEPDGLHHDPWLELSQEVPAAVLALEAQNDHLTTENVRLAEQAHKDPLTGLENRRSLAQAFTSLCHALSAAKSSTERRQGTTDSAHMLQIDLDNFAAVNTGGGHSAGDNVLKAVANILKASVRERDIVARTGGDEMTILLPRITVRRATEIAEQICRQVRENTPVTVSIGLGEIDPRKDLETNLKDADTALYRAKKGGKDIVVRFDHSSD